MGCTESLPVVDSYNVVHNVDPKIPSLGSSHGAAPATAIPHQLIVREKLFSWSGDSFKLKTREGNTFGDHLAIKGKSFAFRDQMVLENSVTNEPVAICLRKFEVLGQTFKIYSPQPLYPGQTPSDRKYNDTPLYTWYKVERKPLTSVQQVSLDNETSPSYTVHRAGAIWPKKRVVKRHGTPAALMDGGTWEGNWNSYLLTVNPGIDPCLCVCLAVICDEMDED